MNQIAHMFFDVTISHIVGASPEFWFASNTRGGGAVVTFARSPARASVAPHYDEDPGAGKELLADQKERAEHVQLLDLGRNDVGRVAHGWVDARVTEHDHRALLA